MDSSKVLMLGALGVGGYLAYRWYQNQAAVAAAPATPAPAAAVPTSPAPATLAPATPAPVTVAPVAPAPVTHSLDSIYSALSAAALAAGVNLGTGVASGTNVGPDGWNYYLATVYSLPGGGSLPDPNSVFPGVDRSQPMSLATYWASMAPWLGSHAGLSGLGLFGGLGAVLRRERGW